MKIIFLVIYINWDYKLEDGLNYSLFCYIFNINLLGCKRRCFILFVLKNEIYIGLIYIVFLSLRVM